MDLQKTALVASALLIAACGGGDASGDGTMGATESGSGNDPTSETSGTGGVASSGTDSGVGTTGTGQGTSETGEATTEGSGETGDAPGLEVVVLPSSVAVLEEDEMGELTVACMLIDNGVPVVDTAAFSVALSPNKGFAEVDGVYTFPNTGEFEVSCSLEHGGQRLEASQTVAVLNESIDPAMAQIGAGMGQLQSGVLRVLAADNEDDQLLFDAIDALDASIPQLESTRVAELQDVLRVLPGGYPTGPELEAAGIMPSPDDASFEAALDELDAVLGTFEASLAAADPMSTDEALLDSLEGDMDEFEAAVSALEALSPSPHGLLQQRARVASLVGERFQPAMHQSAQYLSQHIGAQAQKAPKGTSFHFGLLGFTLGMFGQSNLRIQLINKWYGKYIAQLDESINNFALSGLIDEVFPVGGEGPIIDFLQTSASQGFATPGYESWIDGQNFDENDGGFNLVLVFGDNWQNIVTNIITACGIEESDHPAEAVEKFVGCVEEIEDAVDSLFWYPVAVGPGQFGSPQGLDMGPFPDACSGGLPTATFVLPMTWKGRGPSVFVNCI